MKPTPKHTQRRTPQNPQLDTEGGWQASLDRWLRRDRRKRRRTHLRGFRCRYGELVDFSESGFGVVHQTARGEEEPEPGDRIELVLTYAGQSHRVEAEVVRVAWLSPRCSDVGLKLVQAGPATRAWLATLARRGETIGAGPQAWVPAAG